MVVPFRCSQPFLESSRRIHMSSRLSELLVAGGRAITWLVTELLTVGCLFLASSAA